MPVSESIISLSIFCTPSFPSTLAGLVNSLYTLESTFISSPNFSNFFSVSSISVAIFWSCCSNFTFNSGVFAPSIAPNRFDFSSTNCDSLSTNFLCSDVNSLCLLNLYRLRAYLSINANLLGIKYPISESNTAQVAGTLNLDIFLTSSFILDFNSSAKYGSWNILDNISAC